jgi:hypothetical protein
MANLGRTLANTRPASSAEANDRSPSGVEFFEFAIHATWMRQSEFFAYLIRFSDSLVSPDITSECPAYSTRYPRAGTTCA